MNDVNCKMTSVSCQMSNLQIQKRRQIYAYVCKSEFTTIHSSYFGIARLVSVVFCLKFSKLYRVVLLAR
jgi:hypothetical protein